MFKKIKTFIIVGFAGLAMTAPGLVAVPVLGGVASAAIKDSLCQGTNDAADTTGAGAGGTACDKGGGTGADPAKGLAPLAGKVVNFFTIVVGAIAIIMVIYGGFRYITSGGDSGKVGSAKNTLIYAIVGLIIVALAQILVHFVINTASNSSESFN